MTTERAWRLARLAAWFTIAYNLVEGNVASFFGVRDETLAVFGFGMDSFIEAVSGVGILMMVRRIEANPASSRGEGEARALRITGWCFRVLAAFLGLGAILQLAFQRKPESGLAGAIITTISILVMLGLYRVKMRAAVAVGSAALASDAKCTLVCIWMSVITLASAALFTLTGFGWLDALGALGLAWFSWREGNEALEKAKGAECGCH